MASQRRPAQLGGGASRRRRAAEIGRRSRFHIPWTRRVGALAALTLLGASLVMAASGRTDGGRGVGGSDAPGASPQSTARIGARTPTASKPPGRSTPLPPTGSPPPGAGGPTLDLPATSWTRTTLIDVPGSLPAGWVRRGAQRLRVFVDGKLARQVRVPPGSSFVVRAIPVKVGRHRVKVTVRGPDGETPPSQTAIVIVDQTPPTLTIGRPYEGEVVNSDHATFEGTLADGAGVTVRNDSTSAIAAGEPSGEGAFSLLVPLGVGVNTFTVRGTDHAGNAVSEQRRVVHGEARPSASLRLSAGRIRLTSLPERMTLRVTVRDAELRPVAGAAITFTLSPPGLPTLTYRAESASDGTAAWEGVSLTRDGAIAGNGFATVFVSLPNGGTIQETAPFRFE